MVRKPRLERDVVQLHLAHLRRRRLAAGTIEARERALKRLGRQLGIPLLAATADDLTNWLDGLTVIDNTVCHYASHVRCFYRWCAERGHIPANPAADLDVPVLVRGLPREWRRGKVQVLLTPEEWAGILALRAKINGPAS